MEFFLILGGCLRANHESRYISIEVMWNVGMAVHDESHLSLGP
jgi:hypothetical protein